MATEGKSSNWTRDASNPAVPQSDPLANMLFIRVNPYDPHNPCDYAFGLLHAAVFV
jgi:hypothetical protein